ncbi:glycosyltransferase family protein [Gammaproteobacteria bacterium]|nr:glycosyltransferase family protein [Gammaproteobacteria bacterium]
MTRIVASIEARMGSSRLPGKVLMDIEGQPALQRLLTRLRSCRCLDDIVLATSTSPADDTIAEWATNQGLAFHRGSEDDVLQRVVESHQIMKSDIIVEVTGDCTLLDPEIIDLGVETFLANDCDVVTNGRVPSYPQGADVQVFRAADLADVAKTIHDPAVREHVSLYFYENTSLYRLIHLIAPVMQRAPDVRLQLDYPEDLQFICEVYRRLEPKFGPCFGVSEILALLKQDPEVARINAHCVEKSVR